MTLTADSRRAHQNHRKPFQATRENSFPTRNLEQASPQLLKIAAEARRQKRPRAPGGRGRGEAVPCGCLAGARVAGRGRLSPQRRYKPVTDKWTENFPGDTNKGRQMNLDRFPRRKMTKKAKRRKRNKSASVTRAAEVQTWESEGGVCVGAALPGGAGAAADTAGQAVLKTEWDSSRGQKGQGACHQEAEPRPAPATPDHLRRTAGGAAPAVTWEVGQGPWGGRVARGLRAGRVAPAGKGHETKSPGSPVHPSHKPVLGFSHIQPTWAVRPAPPPPRSHQAASNTQTTRCLCQHQDPLPHPVPAPSPAAPPPHWFHPRTPTWSAAVHLRRWPWPRTTHPGPRQGHAGSGAPGSASHSGPPSHHPLLCHV